MLQPLLQEIYCDAKNQDGHTALHLAARGGHLDCVRTLLDGGCRVNALSRLELSALHLSISEGHEDISILLVHAGSNVNAAGNKDPCLHLAVKHNSPTLVQCLISATCDVNICDHRQQTALHVAAEMRQAGIVEQLLKAGANLHLQDQQGRTPLDVAVRGQHASLADTFIKAERHRAAHTEESLDLSLGQVKDLSRVRSVLWTLATKLQRPGDWKRLAHHWHFTAEHIRALETQWTGSDSYKEHGYRMLLIWLHGVASEGKHPIKELYESLVDIGNTELAEKVRREANADGEPARRCVQM